MASFISRACKPANDMGDAAVRTEKGLQLKVLGGIAALAVVMVLIVLLFLETTTISYAIILVLLALLGTIGYLAVEL